jgi:hypothetical protein
LISKNKETLALVFDWGKKIWVPPIEREDGTNKTQLSTPLFRHHLHLDWLRTITSAFLEMPKFPSL